MWKLCNILFGWDYVLIHMGGTTKIRRAYRLGVKLYTNPYLPDTRVELLPGGDTTKVSGYSYVNKWEPLTTYIKEYHENRPPPKVRDVYRTEIINEIIIKEMNIIEESLYDGMKRENEILNNQLQTANNIVKKLKRRLNDE